MIKTSLDRALIWSSSLYVSSPRYPGHSKFSSSQVTSLFSIFSSSGALSARFFENYFVANRSILTSCRLHSLTVRGAGLVNLTECHKELRSLFPHLHHHHPHYLHHYHHPGQSHGLPQRVEVAFSLTSLSSNSHFTAAANAASQFNNDIMSTSIYHEFGKKWSISQSVTKLKPLWAG